jgi:leucyl-tRNA synthetase
VPVPYEDLPVVLPEDCVPDGSGNPLNKREDFLKCACPKCGKPARRETDTMDTFVDSSWYFMRYASAGAQTMVDARNDHWNPMDQYIGGISHAILHLLYARFWTKVMRDLKGEFPGDPARGMVKFDEPFTKLLTQGMVLNHIYLRRNEKGGIDYHAPDAVQAKHDEHGKVTGYVSKIDGLPVEYDGIGTMSKSKLNGVDPQDIIDKYGADASRLFVMFAAPPELTIEWSDAGVEGANRFLNRVWRFVSGVSDVSATCDWKTADANIRNARMELHKTLAQATFDYGRAQYNTVVSACMKMLNTLEKVPSDSPAGAALRAEGTSILLRTLYPVTPHITSALWRNVGYEKLHGSLLDAPWPEVAADALQQDEIELVLQINGKTRGKVTVPAKATREEVEELVRMDETALKYAEGGIKKVIVVPGRLVNVVV